MSVSGFIPLPISSEDELFSVLANFPDLKTESWVKNISQLYQEIQQGECVLGMEGERLHRRVDVVAIRCFYTDEAGQRFQIFEEKQEFKNGQVRERGYTHVSEKLFFGEVPENGARRGLAEELNISGPEVHLELIKNKCRREESNTYKGLSCTFNMHVFSCEIPPSLYQPNYVEEESDKSTFFSWVKI